MATEESIGVLVVYQIIKQTRFYFITFAAVTYLLSSESSRCGECYSVLQQQYVNICCEIVYL